MPVSRCLPFTEGGISLPWFCCERGFVVEQVDVREAFALEEAEDAFGFGGEVGERASRAVGTAEPVADPRRVRAGAQPSMRAERGAAEGAGGGAEERAAGGVVFGSRGEGSWFEIQYEDRTQARVDSDADCLRSGLRASFVVSCG